MHAHTVGERRWAATTSLLLLLLLLLLLRIKRETRDEDGLVQHCTQ